MDLLISIIVNALLLCYVLPHIRGFNFTGKLWHGVAYAVGLELLGILLLIGCVFFTLITFGMGLYLIVFSFLFGFWAVNGILLRWLAAWFPTYLKISGWRPALIAGLVLLVVDLVVGFACSHFHQSVLQIDGHTDLVSF